MANGAVSAVDRKRATAPSADELRNRVTGSFRSTGGRLLRGRNPAEIGLRSKSHSPCCPLFPCRAGSIYIMVASVRRQYGEPRTQGKIASDRKKSLRRRGASSQTSSLGHTVA